MKNDLLNISQFPYTFEVKLSKKTSIDFATEVLKRISNMFSNWKHDMFPCDTCLYSKDSSLLICFYDEEDNCMGSFLYFVDDVSSYPFDVVRSYYLKSDKIGIIQIGIEPYKSCVCYLKEIIKEF